MKMEEPAAEAKKAESASCITLWTPTPPTLTGRDAWAQAEFITGELGPGRIYNVKVMGFSFSMKLWYTNPQAK